MAKREEVSPWLASWALRKLQAGLAIWASTATVESKVAVEGSEATALRKADAVAGTRLLSAARQSRGHWEAKEPAQLPPCS